MELLFYHSYVWVQRHKLLAFMFAFLFLLGCGFLASRIRFEEDITQILPKHERSDELSRTLKQINFADKITVLIEKKAGGSSEELRATAEGLTDSLVADSAHIKQLRGKIEQSEMAETYQFVYQYLPLFLDRSDYPLLAQRLQPDSITAQVDQNYRSLLSPAGLFMRDFIQQDPLGLAFIGLQKIQKQQAGEQFMLYEGFISTRDTSQLLLFIDPVFQGSDTEHNTALATRLYQLQNSLAEAQPNIRISYFGAPLIAVANAQQIKRDISTTVLISMSVLMLLLILFYRKLYIPLLVFIPTVFAALFSVAVLYLYKPVISAISLSVAAVLVGITIDYSLHILTHYKKSGDIRALYQELTRPLLMSGATNAVVFLCLLFVHSEALIDLGIFASLCIFSSSVFTLLIVPHLYKPKSEIRQSSLLDKLAGYPFERSKVLIGLCLGLILISCFTQGKVGYNNNLSDLNFVPKTFLRVEQKLDKLLHTAAKSLYVVATGNSFEQAAQRSDSLRVYLARAKAEQRIMDYQGIHLIPLSKERQQQHLQDWKDFWQKDKREVFIQHLQAAEAPYGFSEDAHADFYAWLREPTAELPWQAIQQQPVLGASDFIAERDGFFTISSLVKLQEDKREAFLAELAQKPGFLVIDRQQLNETFLGQLRNDFNRLVSYSSLAVLLILWLFFRRLELVLLSAIPIGLTGLVTAGLMGLFGLEFNIFSGIVCTLVFGHGVDFSIFMTAALQKEYSSGKESLQTYRTSILLAVLTTVLAIGALVFAKHPALLSIASVTLIGVFAAVIITFVFYPILFQFFIANRAKQGKSPYTVGMLVLSSLFFAYFGLGSLLLSLIGRLLFPLLPLNKARKAAYFHRLMRRFMKSVLYLHPQTKHQTINSSQESFAEPAVIIANHSSFLDILSLGMLLPKAVFLVNDWVWNSPVFGRAVRALGCFPVSQGLDAGMEQLRAKVDAGYSLIVFPEGTRSADNVLKRFHKGAFYLAEQWQLPILPVYLLGNGDVLPKGDGLIYGGKMTLVIGERISPTACGFGVGYLARSKTIAKYYRQQYQVWRAQVEGPFYFQQKIELAYRYKDEELVKSVQQSIQRYALAYHRLGTQLSETAALVHLSDTYGEFDYLLSLQAGKRKVWGMLADADKCAVAESIYWKQLRNITFSAPTHASYPILVVHPELQIEELSEAFLQGFTEIYTFKTSNRLSSLGWLAEACSEGLFRYHYAGRED